MKKSLPHKRFFELCAGCGICNDRCAVNYQGTESTGTCTTPQDIAKHLLHLDKVHSGSTPGDEEAREIGQVTPTYICTACELCDFVCPYFVRFFENLIDAREWIRNDNIETVPKAVLDMEDHIFRTGNPFGDPRENRDEWIRDDHPEKEKADIVYYPGCQSAYQLFTMEKSLLKVLEASGYSVTYPGKDDMCCGRPLFFSGRNESIAKVAEHNVGLVLAKGARTLVASCSSCYLAFKKDYPPVVGKLPFEVYHTVEFINVLIKEGRLKFERSFNKKVVYHDPCELARGGGILEPPREVLRSLPGVELIELDRNLKDGLCCGGGGLFEAVDETQSYHIGEIIVREASDKGAEVLATACPTCNTVFNMAKNNLVKRGEIGKKFKILDIAEIVSKCL
jgi:heterodisulfide reductase subunit D